MVFSSTLFICLYLPLVLLGYFLTPLRLRNLFLLGVSLVFYAWGEAFLVFLLLGSLLLNYFLANAIHHLQVCGSSIGSIPADKFLVTVAIMANLLPLGYFKYANFAVHEATRMMGSDLPLWEKWVDIALPLGISFFTFQAMSYVIDVYRQETKPARSFIDFACYVTCFPQLVAGPIVRYKDMASELRARKTTMTQLSTGTRLFILGLSKKVLIANMVAPLADHAFSLLPGDLSPHIAWAGAVAYALQIYFDFSGYSDMAIGLGLLFGFHFPINFRYPYIAASMQDFWRRWHISLSTWFRDYLYIPLGGSRHSPVRTCFNLWVVFLLCGLWHGASWNFVIWGGFHGIFLVLERTNYGGKILCGLPRPIRHGYVLVTVLVSWVVFRAETLPHAVSYLQCMFAIRQPASEFFPPHILTPALVLTLVVGAISSVPLFGFRHKLPIPVRETASIACYLLLLSLSLTFLTGSSFNPFLYFRF